MTGRVPERRGAARELRDAFDRSFASPAAPNTDDRENFLMIRVSGDPYAVRLRDIAGVVANQSIASVPTARSDVLGLTGLRGAIVPVFSLAVLLGHGPDPDPPRWMVLSGADDTMAFAFSHFESYVRLTAAARDTDADDRDDRLGDVVRTDAGARTVINMPLIVAAARGAQINSGD
ncbi:MAG TPA: chemotaxis protein CheW, partial [Gemmatimonadaceae bacterium]|nr:chemotaxis protein CheW [Gemmatimonadaceae bacterium]